MSIGRLSSMLSITSTHIFAVVLLAGFLPGAKANCWVDNNGVETCDGLSNVARVMIGIAFFIILLIVLFSLNAHCKRRNRRAELVRIPQAQPETGWAAYPSPFSNGADDVPPPFAPQYPPPVHNGPNYPYNYRPSSGFAPPSGAPPQYYGPPPGEPPSKGVF